MSTVTPPPAEAKQLSIRDHLQSPVLIEEIRKALPSHMSAERMARVALTAMTRVPKLAECTQQSFFKCLLDLSAWGLEPDGRRAHLIPYGKECTLILDYKGIVELAYRSGFVTNIHADVVRTGDVFEFSLGKVTKHTPWAFRVDADKPKEAGEIVAAYTIIDMRDGASKHEVMTRDEVDLIRKRSRAGGSGPWQTDFSEMAKKTVFRRASKWLPLSAEAHDAFERDCDKPPEIAYAENKKIQAFDIQELLGPE
jgi:recombination protein RecT